VSVAPWERIGSAVVGDFEIFRVRRERALSPRTGVAHTFHMLELPRFVQVIPVTAEGDVILVEQFRHAAGTVTLEFPAGRMEPGEAAEAAALRELREETGYVAARAVCVAELWSDPALHRNSVAVVVAAGCVAGGDRALDPSEDLAVRTVRRAEVSRLIACGDIRHATSVAAWYRYVLSESAVGSS
jgi:ADP-ribose pyrophosphatase